MRAFFRDHPLLAYFILAYALSWSWWIPMAVKGAVVVPGGTVSHFPGLAGPALAAFLVPIIGGDRESLRVLLRRLGLVTRPAWRFLLLSLSPLLFLALALAIAGLSGAPVPPLADFARYSGLPAMSLWAVVAVAFLVNGFGEETGWRGFALPRLQQRFGPLGGTLLLALLWAGWHAPVFRVIETYRLMTPPMIVFGFLLGITSGALVLAHVAHETRGSILAVALWHLGYNLTSTTVGGRGLVSAVTTTCVMMWAAVLLIFELRRGRNASRLSVPLVERAASAATGPVGSGVGVSP